MLMAALYDSVVLEGTSNNSSPKFHWQNPRTNRPIMDVQHCHYRSQQRFLLAARSPACNPIHSCRPRHMAQHRFTNLDTRSLETRRALFWRRPPSRVVRLPRSPNSFPIQRQYSYQVPKEVGKVGTESPTFIEPIGTRKDGIQAMFSKQVAKSKSFQASPPKRSRSPADNLDIPVSPETKKTKIEKIEENDVKVINNSPITPKVIQSFDTFMTCIQDVFRQNPRPSPSPARAK